MNFIVNWLVFLSQADYLFFNCIVVQQAIVNKAFHNGDYEMAKTEAF